MSTTAIKEDIGAFFGAGPAASGAAMETTEEEEEEKEATEAVAAPESPGQIFLSHTSLDYPHDDPVKRHIIEEVWRQLSEDRGLPVFLDSKVLRSGVQLRQRLCKGIYILDLNYFKCIQALFFDILKKKLKPKNF